MDSILFSILFIILAQAASEAIWSGIRPPVNGTKLGTKPGQDEGLHRDDVGDQRREDESHACMHAVDDACVILLKENGIENPEKHLLNRPRQSETIADNPNLSDRVQDIPGQSGASRSASNDFETD